jgi:hypothetical protein
VGGSAVVTGAALVVGLLGKYAASDGHELLAVAQEGGAVPVEEEPVCVCVHVCVLCVCVLCVCAYVCQCFFKATYHVDQHGNMGFRLLELI